MNKDTSQWYPPPLLSHPSLFDPISLRHGCGEIGNTQSSYSDYCTLGSFYPSFLWLLHCCFSLISLSYPLVTALTLPSLPLFYQSIYFHSSPFLQWYLHSPTSLEFLVPQWKQLPFPSLHQPLQEDLEWEEEHQPFLLLEYDRNSLRHGYGNRWIGTVSNRKNTVEREGIDYSALIHSLLMGV